MGVKETLTQVGSLLASLLFLYPMLELYFPPLLRARLRTYIHKLTSLLSPYITITFSEFSGDRLRRSEAYSSILTYLSENSSQKAKRLKAEVVKDSQNPLVLTMDDNEEITDEFQGVKLWWAANKSTLKSQSFSVYPASDEKRFLTLTFHKRYRDLIVGPYLKHVLEEGKQLEIKNRRVKLYTNNPSQGWYGYKRTKWSHVAFEHPASFDTLAMDPKDKKEIMNDLLKFKNGKDYYAKIGKSWKRGYLLYGPPGTGKSTMIVAMANFMNYDVYDLELTAVKENAELRKLLIETSSKSIIVIEDIDCSLDLTGQRKKKKKDDDDKGKDTVSKKIEEEEKDSKVTLSGLLNFIDGIWSACGGERIIIFTTNFVDKLDPALIRKGRMDKHIEMSYCRYEAFKILAKNYLDIESHDLYTEIEKLLGEVNMIPADVAENLMPKSDEEDEETCLKKLISALEKEKEEAKKKKKEEDEANKKTEEEEEARLKAEKEKEKSVEKVVTESGKCGEEVKENGN